MASTEFMRKVNERNKYVSTAFAYPLNVDYGGNGMSVLFNINAISGGRFDREENRFLAGDDTPVVQQAGSNSIRSQVNVEGSYKRIDDSILLPMPEQIQHALSLDWSGTELGSAAKVAAAAGSLDQTSIEQIGNSVREGALNTLTGLIQQFSPVNAKDTVELTRGTVQNPFIETLFRGVGLRSFNFSWVLAAESLLESQEIDRIIETFRIHSLPEVKYDGSNSYFLYPSTVDVTFLDNGSQSTKIPRISTCALTSVDVTYGDSKFNVLEDGSPAIRTLSLSLLETEIMTKGRVTEGF